MRFMKIAVAGTGYVGLVAGVAFAEIGHQVICVDVSEEKIKTLQKGVCPIYEEGLQELMIKNRNRLKYTTNYRNAYSEADVIFVGVGTPEKEDGSANLEYVLTVVENIVESITKDMVVVIKSTVPIGTNNKIENIFNEKLCGRYKVSVVSNPEFLAQGNAMKDTLYASRIVIGVEDDWASEIMDRIYYPLTKEPYCQRIVKTNRASAEMIKYASNDFLALKISYINEIANLCEKLGANIDDVTYGMGLDPRIGNRFLQAGIGYGGSCFPKDTKALHWLSKEVNCETTLIREAIRVNQKQKTKMFYEMYNYFDGKIENKRIAVLGVTFKPNTDDLREAPSVDNVKLLLNHDVKVSVYDPVGMDNFQKIFKNQVQYADSIESCLEDADACLIMTEWNEIKSLNPTIFSKHMKEALVFDGRNCFELDVMEKNQIQYRSVGRVKNKHNKVSV